MCRFLNLFFTDIVTDGYTKVLFKNTGQITLGQPGILSQNIDGNAFFDVRVDVVDTLHDRL